MGLNVIHTKTKTSSNIGPDLLNFVQELIKSARAEITPRYRQKITVATKQDSSPVTEADKYAEQAMRDLIERRFPDHGIIGEEFDDVRTDAEFVWVLDPIDGTKCFVTGIPLFATLIALTHNGKPILGVADQAILNETWLAGQNVPATMNTVPISTRTCRLLSDAVMFTTGLEYWSEKNRPRLDALMAQTHFTRMGADAYGFLQVANGFADLTIESGLNAFDVMAVIPIVENAGGRITDFAGNPLTLEFNGSVVASGDPSLHEKILEVIQNAA